MAVSMTHRHTFRIQETVTDPKDHVVVVATLTECTASDGGWFEVHVTSAAQIDLVTVDGTAVSLTPAAGVLPYKVPFKVASIAATSVATSVAVR